MPLIITGVNFTGGFTIAGFPIRFIDTENGFDLTDENGNTFITE